MTTLTQGLAIALQHHQAGRLELAAEIYRRILEADQDQADAWHLLGVIARDTGERETAIQHLRRAVALNSRDASYHNNLGIALAEQGDLEEAIECYRRAIELSPGFAEAHNNLGNALIRGGKLEDAIRCYRAALRLKPEFAQGYNNLGNALRSRGSSAEAAECYQEALRLQPDSVLSLSNLGTALKELGRLDEAMACHLRAIQVSAKEDALSRASDLAPTADSRGTSSPDCPCSAERSVEQAGFYNNLGNVLKEQGLLAQAVDCYRRAMTLKPDYVRAHSNLIYTLNYCDDADSQAIFEEARRWNQRHAEPLARFIKPHANDCSPLRCLRVGYVSPDFREHVVGRNVLPILENHDHEAFRIYCYADVVHPDQLTERFRSCADCWQPTVGLESQQVAELVRQDEIDILVDLTLHTAGGRLIVFAQKPAPVQVTFAGYPGTTGLSAIDYRLSDPYLDPPETAQPCSAEEIVRLPDSFWCYDPLGAETPVSSLPSLRNGFITFGCLNNFCKINPRVLELWARVLIRANGSRLVLRAEPGSHRQRALDLLQQHGIAGERVSFVSNMGRARYLQLYHQIDLGLDTVPYNGHTTSLDAFWMGVPVITLVGQTAVGRAGLSQLTNLGLPELAATTPDEFVNMACQWAADPPRLATIRAALRDRMRSSPLMDARRFARNVEAAYRVMWQRWCASAIRG